MLFPLGSFSDEKKKRIHALQLRKIQSYNNIWARVCIHIKFIQAMQQRVNERIAEPILGIIIKTVFSSGVFAQLSIHSNLWEAIIPFLCLSGFLFLFFNLIVGRHKHVVFLLPVIQSKRFKYRNKKWPRKIAHRQIFMTKVVWFDASVHLSFSFCLDFFMCVCVCVLLSSYFTEVVQIDSG